MELQAVRGNRHFNQLLCELLDAVASKEEPEALVQATPHRFGTRQFPVAPAENGKLENISQIASQALSQFDRGSLVRDETALLELAVHIASEQSEGKVGLFTAEDAEQFEGQQSLDTVARRLIV